VQAMIFRESGWSFFYNRKMRNNAILPTATVRSTLAIGSFDADIAAAVRMRLAAERTKHNGFACALGDMDVSVDRKHLTENKHFRFRSPGPESRLWRKKGKALRPPGFR
jgi:hypothetical protein